MPSLATCGAASIYGFTGFPQKGSRLILALYHMDGADNSTTFLDATGHSTATQQFSANAKLSTSFPKFGSACLSLNGNGSVAVAMNAEIGVSDFTIEMWVRLDSLSGVQIFYDQRGLGTTHASDIAPVLYWDGSAFAYFTGGAQKIRGGAATVGVYAAIAVSRNAGVTRLYVNGTMVGSFADTNVYINSVASVGGNRVASDSSIAGRIDEVRVSLIGYYDTASYTVQTEPFTYGV